MMKLFGKKNEPAAFGSSQETSAPAAAKAALDIKVLGAGCARCIALEAAVKEALQELGLTSAVEHVTDYAQIAAYGVMSTPALVINGKVVSYGKALKKDEVIALLNKVRG